MNVDLWWEISHSFVSSKFCFNSAAMNNLNTYVYTYLLHIFRVMIMMVWSHHIILDAGFETEEIVAFVSTYIFMYITCFAKNYINWQHSSRYYSEHINRDKVSFSIESRVLWQCQIWFISFRREWQKSRHRRHYFTYIHSIVRSKKKNYVDLANISLCFYVKLLTKKIWSSLEKIHTFES